MLILFSFEDIQSTQFNLYNIIRSLHSFYTPHYTGLQLAYCSYIWQGRLTNTYNTYIQQESWTVYIPKPSVKTGQCMVQKLDSNTQEEVNTTFNHCAILLVQHPSLLPHLFIEYTP